MPATPHVEKHFTSAAMVRDVVIGMSDGLTVPFALAAGLSGAVGSTAVVVTAGFAEMAAGAISMGLGGYLAGRTDVEHFEAERTRETLETQRVPDLEREEVATVFRSYGLNPAEAAPVIAAITADRDRWVDFMMRFELGLERPDPARARTSALTIALSYVAGGLIPLSPYLVLPNIQTALLASVGVTMVALFVFGYVKGTFTGLHPLRSAVQTVLIGGVAAAVAFAIARLIA
jgi:VIT1/CCC1 family predicted Fe2+/Mn2+ transporter